VTNAEPLPNPDQHDAAPARGSSLGKRIAEWFWRGAALAETARAFPELSPRAAQLAERARSTADIADMVCGGADSARGTPHSGEPVLPLAEASASELYWQSAYWALRALAADSSEAADASGAVATSYSESLWDSLDERLLVRAASKPERLEALRASIRRGSFLYFAELSPSERLVLCPELRKLAELLLAKFDERTRAMNRVLLQRASRVGLVLLLVLLLLVGVRFLRQYREDRSDLVEGKPWVTSSNFDGSGCHSPSQTCPENTGYFFHTQEEQSPWVEFDLGAAQRIATIQVDNRRGAFGERAVPLVAEVSTDHKHWKQVARRDSEFVTWREPVAPVSARWLRLRAVNRTFLHLSRVRIFP